MTPSVCLLIIDDGRADYLERCLASAAENLSPLDACVMVSDPDHELGFAGAIEAGWEGVRATGCEYVLHLESDFLFTCPAPVEEMCRLIAESGGMRGVEPEPPRIIQVALKRQAWNERERAAGGIVEADPGDFQTVSAGLTYTRHRKFFTTTPSVYPAFLCERGWPQVEHSEGVFTHQLLEEGFEFAFYGAGHEPPRVWHIGEERAGNGY